MVPSWFSREELAGLPDFWSVYTQHYDALNASALKAVAAEPQLAALIASLTPEQLEANQRDGLERMKRLIAGDWADYQTNLQQQAIVYAKLGVSFTSWYRLIRIAARDLTPLLVQTYASEPDRLASALVAMQSFFDWAMATLGEVYLGAKEADLRATSEDLATTLNSIGDGVIATDTQGHVTRMNPVAERLTGWSNDVARGKALAEVFQISAGNGQMLESPAARVLREGAIVGLTNNTTLLSRDGSRRPISNNASPIRDEGGAIRGAVLVFRDQSEQHAADAARAASESRYRAFAEAGLMGVVELASDGRIVEANQVFLSMIGGDAQRTGQLHWKDLTPPEHLAADALAETEVEEQGKGRLYEKELLGAKGKRVPVIIGLAALENGKRIALVLDISQQKQVEAFRLRSAQLESDNRRIQEANRLKSEFLANMSHELRTPLNAIIGFADLLHDDQVPRDSPQFKEFLGDILTSGRHLLQLINDVLDLSKVEAGRVEFYPEVVSLQRVVAEVVAILRTTAANKRINVVQDIAPDLESLFIDAGRLKQVLYNYLSNALKFTPEGGRITVRGRRDGNDNFRLEVVDTGIGIAPGDIDKLFIEFQQLDAGAAKKHAGTGLGLALTRRLVEAQDGTVGVDSALGKGSTFFAVLPRVGAGQPVPPSRRIDGRRGAPAILVIEDNPRDQAAIVKALSTAGYEVETASNAAQAAERCAARSFDAVTLDLLLPDASGLDVLRVIRNGERNHDVPVIVITVVADQGAAGGFVVHDILSKPLDEEAILHSLARAGVRSGHSGSVLVVDDDASSSKLMAATLGQFNYRATAANSGPEGLQFAEASTPMAVILDLLMPGMDGFEFLERFRAVPACANVPVIVWSAKDLNPDELRRLQTSAQGVVQKGQDAGAAVLRALQSFVPPPTTQAGG